MLFQTFLRKSRCCQEICFRTFSSSSSKNDGQNLFPNFLPRTSFELPPNYARIDWHPKHMGLQMKIMEGKLRTVDLILEVHDARVAITGRNPNFGSRLYAIRPHILILNKMDLIDLDRYREPIENHYRNAGIENIFWTDCTKRVDPQWDRLRRKMLELLQGEHRFNRTVKTEYQVMVVGIPNVGKSSLINSLRKNNLGLEKASAEGALPGVTIRVQNRVRIWDRPPIYILDTPGVLNPWIHTMEEAMKLAACNLILGSTTKPHFLADFLLYYFNKYRDFSYVNLLKMNGPSDEIDQLLLHHCKLNNLCVKPSELAFMNKMNKTNQIWDRSAATTQFLQLFTRGKIVDKFLDRDLLGFHDSSTNPTRTEGEKIERRKRRYSPD